MVAEPVPTNNALLNKALAYSMIGWRVLPLHNIQPEGSCTCGRDCGGSKGKHPRISNWTELATTDERQIKKWWYMWPDANIGIATGKLSGILVLDCDGPLGRDSIRKMGGMPHTPTAQSGRVDGGEHYYLRWPEGIDRIPNEVKLLPGLDLRTDGGQVVAPPSHHYSGTEYEWLLDPFEDAELAECPTWIIELALKPKEKKTAPAPAKPTTSDEGKKKYLEKVLQNHCERISTAEKGERHRIAFESARVIGGFIAGEGMDEFEAERRLFDASMSFAGADPKERKEVVRDGIAAGKREPLTIPPLEPRKILSFPPPPNVNPNTGEIVDDSELLDFEATDEGNALAFIHLHGEQFLYCDAYGWMYWNSRCWEASLAESRLDKLVVETFKRRRIAAVQAEQEHIVKCSVTSQAKIAACINRIIPKLQVSVDIFDADPDLINCKNGVILLRTGELTPHSPEQHFSYCIPYEYDKSADYSFWENFLAGAVKDWDKVHNWFQMVVGYSFTGNTNEEKLFYPYGPTRSGKGTFTETLKQLSGKTLSTEVDFTTFTSKRDGDSNNFDLAPLKPARLVFASESERYQRLNPAKIKQLTGGNEIYCSFKHKTHFNYKPQFKMWMSSNWPVNGDVDDDAMWGRVQVIEFPISHLGREDKQLKKKMLSPNNLRGVLRWIVEGAIAWYASPNGLEEPIEIKKSTEAHRAAADYVQMWIDDCCEYREDAWTPSQDLYSSFERWCKEQGYEPKKAKGFTESLSKKGFNPPVPKWVGGKTQRVLEGLVLIVGD